MSITPPPRQRKTPPSSHLNPIWIIDKTPTGFFFCSTDTATQTRSALRSSQIITIDPTTLQPLPHRSNNYLLPDQRRLLYIGHHAAASQPLKDWIPLMDFPAPRLATFKRRLADIDLDLFHILSSLEAAMPQVAPVTKSVLAAAKSRLLSTRDLVVRCLSELDPELPEDTNEAPKTPAPKQTLTPPTLDLPTNPPLFPMDEDDAFQLHSILRTIDTSLSSGYSTVTYHASLLSDLSRLVRKYAPLEPMNPELGLYAALRSEKLLSSFGYSYTKARKAAASLLKSLEAEGYTITPLEESPPDL